MKTFRTCNAIHFVIPHLVIMQKIVRVKWRENAKNLTEPYNGHFENLTEPYSKENKTLQNLTSYLSQVVVTLEWHHMKKEIYMDEIS